MAEDLEASLKKWAEGALEGMGVSRENIANFAELEDKLIANMRATYSEKAIDFSLNPKNMGKLESPDSFARVTGSCGDTIEIYLNIRNGIIAEANFTTDGCVSSIAAGGMVAELARGRRLAEVEQISQEEVLSALGGLPEENEHCALLAADTMKEAIKNYLDNNRDKTATRGDDLSGETG